MKNLSTVLVLMGLSLPVVAQDASPAPGLGASRPLTADADTQNPWVEVPIEQENAPQDGVTLDNLTPDITTTETVTAEGVIVEIPGELASERIAAGAQAAQVAATGTLTTAATVGIGFAAAAAVYSVVADNSDSSRSTPAGGTTGTH
ncbi:hypothetical protein [Stenotrophomonas humi]|uniref:hypothetical protein n=1 Tax=Stenotrophomonas humi TaxID=405444 RepID=UPI000A6B2CE2|nr:hypothetical protein [Stenotrophomonas humi]